MIEQLDAVIRKIEREWVRKRVLVVGDLMIDKYVWGEVSRISPEAPVPVVLGKRETHQPGGAANVAMNLTRLGAKASVIGFTGDDENERLLEQSLRANGIDPMFVRCREFPTISKVRILCGARQMLRLDTEGQGNRSEEEYAKLISTVCSNVANYDALIVSDYAKGVLTYASCQAVINAAAKVRIPILVDPKSADFSWYAGATTICPNLSELSKAIGHDARDLDGLLEKAQSLVDTLGLDFLTATLSEKGIALIRSSSRLIAPADARQVFDVSGAGDTVLSVLALCLVSGLPPEVGVQLANMAAGIVVGKLGTVPVEKYELLAALTPEIALHAKEKVVNLDELLIRVAMWRAKGERVVFTNGCFDLLHVGHITLLEEARRFGDRLVVAVNSDSSVQNLKGPGRPIVSHPDRARVLAALAAVDAVVIFDDSTPIELIAAIRPEILVKGGDYTRETVVGAEELEIWGGQLRIVPTIEGFSTTRLIDSSRQS